ncbi:zeatin O-glucosyltransferase-like [Cucumis melo var. makuwa]|uniref:Glycosyltransferase n=1 Tax=Cucumis melo var. makuwa TaxID=1194695 RepID=A0A5D3E370_CUCMM|nr:zeatin O-glucosyltransferase-like [Cucumis melo var. makuwa]
MSNQNYVISENAGKNTHHLPVMVVMVPLPAQGHLNQLLHLSRLLSAFNIPVHFVGTATHNRQAQHRVGAEISNHLIQFHDFDIPIFPSPSPNPNTTHKFPSHLIPLMTAAAVHLRRPLAAFLSSLSSKAKRLIVIHDSLMSSVVQVVDTIVNVESYNFHSVSAFAATLHCLERKGIGGGDDNCESTKFYKEHNGERSSSKHSCMSWLDQQEPRSVMYISFGTTTTVEDKQIKEIAIGLARSHQKFIWVIRDADKGDIFHDDNDKKPKLPEGYNDLIGDRGLVIREWAPQLEILSHWATGGFMTHCGWNSCMESMTMGVPMAAWPMHSDQPRNTVLVTAILRVGVVVKDWDQGEEVVSALTVEEAVKRLIVSEEGAEIRMNAMRVGEAVRRSIEDGGDSRKELEAFVNHITR